MIGSLAVLQMANSACGNVKGYKEILNIFNHQVVIFSPMYFCGPDFSRSSNSCKQSP